MWLRFEVPEMLIGTHHMHSVHVLVKCKVVAFLKPSLPRTVLQPGGFFSSGCNGGQISTPWSYIKSHGVVTGNYNGTGSIGGGYCSAFSLPHCHRERDDQTAS